MAENSSTPSPNDLQGPQGPPGLPGPVGPPGPAGPSLPADPGIQWRSKSFDFVGDATKQLITVATGIITVTVIFSKDLTTTSRWFALLVWFCFLVSVFFGVLALNNMAGVLDGLAKGEKPKPGEEEAGIYAGNTKVLSIVQIVAFVVGLLLLFPFGFFAAKGIGNSDNKANQQQSITVTCVTPPAQPPQPCSQQPGGNPGKGNGGNGGKKGTQQRTGCPATK